VNEGFRSAAAFDGVTREQDEGISYIGSRLSARLFWAVGRMCIVLKIREYDRSESHTLPLCLESEASR